MSSVTNGFIDNRENCVFIVLNYVKTQNSKAVIALSEMMGMLKDDINKFVKKLNKNRLCLIYTILFSSLANAPHFVFAYIGRGICFSKK